MALAMISSPRRFTDTIDAPSSITLVDGSIPPVELADLYINTSTNLIWLCVNAGSVSGSTQSGIIWKLMPTVVASGVAQLSLGTATVLTSSVTSSSKITLSAAGPSGNVGSWKVSAVVSGVSFTIVSSSATDTSQVAWAIS